MSNLSHDVEHLARSGLPSLADGLAVMDLARRIIAGDITDPKEIARALVGLALDHAPVAELAPYLDEEARRRADLVADLAEAAKFGG